MDTPDISVITTIHREGKLISASLQSIEAAVNEATCHGLKVEWLLVLDAADDETSDFLKLNMPPGARSIELECKDTGLARNTGIAATNGKFIAISDADDLWSANWLSAAHSFAVSYGNPLILHPMLMIHFGTIENIAFSVDSDSKDFSPLTFLDINHWSSNTFTQRNLHLKFPYCTSFDINTGLGFEDWHFHCDTLAAGIHHKAVNQTFHCYRAKQTEESLSARSFRNNLLVPPSKLFALRYQNTNRPISEEPTQITTPKKLQNGPNNLPELDKLHALINSSKLFDEQFYITNLETDTITNDPITHYLTDGWKKEYAPNALFDTKFYYTQYPGLSAIPPLIHYLMKGIVDGKEINSFFDSHYYLNRYPEVAQSGLSAIAHYLHFGADKGYDPSSHFNTLYYLSNNPDVLQAKMNPLAHYLHFGKLEGRPATPIDKNLLQSISQNYSMAQDIEPLLQPLEYLSCNRRRRVRYSSAGPAYGKLVSTLLEPFTHLFALSGNGWTMTEQKALNFARYLSKKNGKNSLVVVCTDNKDRLVAQMFSDHARIVYFDDLETPLDYKAKMIILTRLALQARPKVFHIFESTIGWLSLKAYNRQLKSSCSQIYGYLPSDNLDQTGNLKGTAVSFFSDCVDHLNGVILDNHQLYSALPQQLRLEEKNQNKFMMPGLALDEVKDLASYW